MSCFLALACLERKKEISGGASGDGSHKKEEKVEGVSVHGEGGHAADFLVALLGDKAREMDDGEGGGMNRPGCTYARPWSIAVTEAHGM